MISVVRWMIRAVRRLLVVALSLWAMALLAYHLDWFSPETHQNLGIGLDVVNSWALDRLSRLSNLGSQHIKATIDDLATTLHQDLLAGLQKLGGLALPVLASCVALYFYLKHRSTRRAIRRLLNG